MLKIQRLHLWKASDHRNRPPAPGHDNKKAHTCSTSKATKNDAKTSKVQHHISSIKVENKCTWPITLSRAPRASTVQHADEKDSFDVMTVNYISSSRLEELKKHTAEDTTLQTLSTVIRLEWPSKQHSLPHAIRPYFPFRDELTIEDGVIVKGHKAVIPCSLKKEYISIMHRGHPGVEATKLRARGIVFWPTMTQDIEKRDTVMLCV